MEKRSNRKCCVVNCENTPCKNQELQFYRFPGQSYELKRKKKWIAAVRCGRIGKDGKPWQPGTNSRICSAHFLGGKKSNTQFNESYNPTIFPPIYREKPNLYTCLRVGSLRIQKENIPSSIAITTPINVDRTTYQRGLLFLYNNST